MTGRKVHDTEQAMHALWFSLWVLCSLLLAVASAPLHDGRQASLYVALDLNTRAASRGDEAEPADTSRDGNNRATLLGDREEGAFDVAGLARPWHQADSHGSQTSHLGPTHRTNQTERRRFPHSDDDVGSPDNPPRSHDAMQGARDKVRGTGRLESDDTRGRWWVLNKRMAMSDIKRSGSISAGQAGLHISMETSRADNSQTLGSGAVHGLLLHGDPSNDQVRADGDSNTTSGSVTHTHVTGGDPPSQPAVTSSAHTSERTTSASLTAGPRHDATGATQPFTPCSPAQATASHNSAHFDGDVQPLHHVVTSNRVASRTGHLTSPTGHLTSPTGHLTSPTGHLTSPSGALALPPASTDHPPASGGGGGADTNKAAVAVSPDVRLGAAAGLLTTPATTAATSPMTASQPTNLSPAEATPEIDTTGEVTERYIERDLQHVTVSRAPTLSTRDHGVWGAQEVRDHPFPGDLSVVSTRGRFSEGLTPSSDVSNGEGRSWGLQGGANPGPTPTNPQHNSVDAFRLPTTANPVAGGGGLKTRGQGETSSALNTGGHVATFPSSARTPAGEDITLWPLRVTRSAGFSPLEQRTADTTMSSASVLTTSPDTSPTSTTKPPTSSTTPPTWTTDAGVTRITQFGMTSERRRSETLSLPVDRTYPVATSGVSRADGQQTGVSRADGQQTGVSRADDQQTGVSRADGQQTGVSRADGQQTGVSRADGQQTGVSRADGQQTGVSRADGQQTGVSRADGQQSHLPHPSSENVTETVVMETAAKHATKTVAGVTLMSPDPEAAHSDAVTSTEAVVLLPSEPHGIVLQADTSANSASSIAGTTFTDKNASHSSSLSSSSVLNTTKADLKENNGAENSSSHHWQNSPPSTWGASLQTLVTTDVTTKQPSASRHPLLTVAARASSSDHTSPSMSSSADHRMGDWGIPAPNPNVSSSAHSTPTASTSSQHSLPQASLPDSQHSLPQASPPDKETSFSILDADHSNGGSSATRSGDSSKADNSDVSFDNSGHSTLGPTAGRHHPDDTGQATAKTTLSSTAAAAAAAAAAASTDTTTSATTTTTTTTTTNAAEDGSTWWTSRHASVGSSGSLVVVQLHLQMTWTEFCRNRPAFYLELADILQQDGRQSQVSADQIRLLDQAGVKCQGPEGGTTGLQEEGEITVRLYLVNKNQRYDVTLTSVCAQVIKQGFDLRDTSLFKNKLVDVHLQELSLPDAASASPSPSSTRKDQQAGDVIRDVKTDELLEEPGVTIAVVIASVGGACCVTLIVMQVVLRRRYKRDLRHTARSRSYSASSGDSIALASVTKSRPSSGLFNPALDLGPDQVNPSHVMGSTELVNFSLDLNKVFEEFLLIPNKAPRLSVVPPGAEDKNRFANVLPIPHTRVHLNQRQGDPISNYINANFVTGYGEHKRRYIATQWPLAGTMEDFWRMVWEHRCPAIAMLVNIMADGHVKYPPYFPEYVGPEASVTFGEVCVTMTRRDVHQEYIASTLELLAEKTGEKRCVRHYWLTCWAACDRVEPISLVRFVLDTRPIYQDCSEPLVVHCSTGTGRTGTLLALDICMRQYDAQRFVDVMACVHRLRQERAGCVQTNQQYALLYNALQEYVTIVSSPGISAASSATTLHAMLP